MALPPAPVCDLTKRVRGDHSPSGSSVTEVALMATGAVMTGTPFLS